VLSANFILLLTWTDQHWIITDPYKAGLQLCYLVKDVTRLYNELQRPKLDFYRLKEKTKYLRTELLIFRKCYWDV